MTSSKYNSDSFQCVYAVPMECKSCVDSVSSALNKMQGVSHYDIDLSTQLVAITGCIAPSTIVKAMQSIGKDAIIRGSGANDQSAAVAILETATFTESTKNVKGLARMVAVGPNKLIIDLTISGISQPGIYYPSIRSTGNITFQGLLRSKPFKQLDPISVSSNSDGVQQGQAFLKVDGLSIPEIIGRGFAVSKEKTCFKDDDRSLVGVIARSAGVWLNDKEVCSCTGKNIWQERKDALKHGVDN